MEDMTHAQAIERMEQVRVVSDKAWAEHEKWLVSDQARAKDALRRYYAAENERLLLELWLTQLEALEDDG